MHAVRQFISKAETSKQSSRGAVLVLNTYCWDILAATVVRHSQAVHCSHLRSRVSVWLEAPKGNQRRQQSGERAEQTFDNHVPDPPDHETSIVAQQWSYGLCQPATPARPASIFLPETQ